MSIPPAVNVNQLNQGLGVLNYQMQTQVNRLDNRIDQQERMLSGGIAASAVVGVISVSSTRARVPQGNRDRKLTGDLPGIPSA